jgi:hypothetical protein
MIHKTGDVYSLWFFEELLELIGISRGVHLDLSNGNSTRSSHHKTIPIVKLLWEVEHGMRSRYPHLFK